MKIEEVKIEDEVWVKGIVSDISYNIHGEKMFEVRTSSFETPRGFIHKDYVKTVIDQPKPVVPQFVADWYEEHKDNFYLNLHRLAWELIENLDEDDFVPKKALDSDFKRWYHKTETAIQTLINMHQFGYTAEKEKLYTVEIPTNSEAKLALVRREDKKIVITIVGGRWRGLDIFQLTEAEIRKDFDWAWQFAKEVTE